MDPTHPYAPWCIPESCHVRACVRDLGGRGSDGRAWPIQYAKGVDSVRRWQVAAPSGPAAGTPMPRLPPSPQPAQAIACGSAFRSSVHEAHQTTAAVGYCSVLCGNGTATLPASNLPHHSATGWHACNHEKRGRCTMLHATQTSDQRCAANLVQTTRRMAQRGTQGVLKGTEGYSRALGSWIECMQAL